MTHGFLLAIASLLGGGIFFLPQAVEALSLAWAVSIILGCGAAFAVTTVMFATALDRHLDKGGARDTTNFVGSMLTAHLGLRPAKIVAALLLTQSVLLLYGYVHEVSGRSGSLLGMPALLLAAGVAMTIVIQQRRESIKSSIDSALVLASVNVVTLGTLLILIASGSQWQIDGSALGEISVLSLIHI